MSLSVPNYTECPLYTSLWTEWTEWTWFWNVTDWPFNGCCLVTQRNRTSCRMKNSLHFFSRFVWLRLKRQVYDADMLAIWERVVSVPRKLKNWIKNGKEMKEKKGCGRNEWSVAVTHNIKQHNTIQHNTMARERDSFTAASFLSLAWV